MVTIILAAGKGTRMKSAHPKVLHKVAGKPMISHVLRAAKEAGSERAIAVIGYGSEEVRSQIGNEAEFALQQEQLGTGHAVRQVQPLLEGYDGAVMVLCGDTPLLTGELLRRLYDSHLESGAKATVLTAIMPDATGYGRIVRESDGSVSKIVEHKDATIEERDIKEINSGIYCFDSQSLFSALAEVTNDNAQGEYYLPDVLAILKGRGEKIWAVATADYEATLGINSREQLAAAEKVLRRRKRQELMAAGVTLMDPDTTFVDADVTVGRDTIIYPGVWLEGNTSIGENCLIGPSSRFCDTIIGDNVTAQFVYAHECEVASGVTMGPYVHLRPGTKIATNVHIGNFVEVKNSHVGEGTKLPHLSYIGDADIGAGVNMGCGSITVNYDGKKKFRTTIGDKAFIGCNSNLVAPVTVADNAYIGAGSTITKDVGAGELAIARSRQKNIDHWTDKRR